MSEAISKRVYLHGCDQHTSDIVRSRTVGCSIPEIVLFHDVLPSCHFFPTEEY